MEDNYQNKVAEILIDIKSIRFSFEEPFTLTSGLKSPVYVDCRKIISYVKERDIILNYAIKYFKKNKIEFDLLAGGNGRGNGINQFGLIWFIDVDYQGNLFVADHQNFRVMKISKE